jgi:hypothetical protein
MTWPSTYHLTGLHPVAAPVTDSAAPSMTKHVAAGTAPHPHILDPENPVFWFGVFLAFTLGAVGVAGAVRLGPARARVSVGET